MNVHMLSSSAKARKTVRMSSSEPIPSKECLSGKVLEFIPITGWPLWLNPAAPLHPRPGNWAKNWDFAPRAMLYALGKVQRIL